MKLTIITYTNCKSGVDYIIFDSIDKVSKYFSNNNIDFSALLQPMPGEKNLDIRSFNLKLNITFSFSYFQYFINKLSFDRNKTSILLKIRDFWSVFLLMNSSNFSNQDNIIAVESINCLSLILYKYFLLKDYKVIYF